MKQSFDDGAPDLRPRCILRRGGLCHFQVAGGSNISVSCGSFIGKDTSMTTFEEREKAFERKFAHDEELRFKSTVRRNRLVGRWAAEKLGLAGEDAEAYAKSVVKADFEQPGDEDVLRKLRADFAAKGIDISDTELHRVLVDKLGEAVRQIEADSGKAS
jgi:hypothetical protein